MKRSVLPMFPLEVAMLPNDDLLTRLEPVARSLGCVDELASVAQIPVVGASYQRQRRVAEDNEGDLRAVVDALVGELDI